MNFYVDKLGKMQKIPHSSAPEDQLIYIWEKFVATSSAKDIVIVAHSYGGVATLHLVSNARTGTTELCGASSSSDKCAEIFVLCDAF